MVIPLESCPRQFNSTVTVSHHVLLLIGYENIWQLPENTVRTGKLLYFVSYIFALGPTELEDA